MGIESGVLVAGSIIVCTFALISGALKVEQIMGVTTKRLDLNSICNCFTVYLMYHYVGSESRIISYVVVKSVSYWQSNISILL